MAFVLLVAAWALPLLTLPYHPLLDLYLIFGLNPAGADSLACVMLGLTAFARGYSGPHPYWAAVGLTLVTIWQVIAIPIWIMLLLPIISIVGVGIMAAHVRRPDFLRRSLARGELAGADRDMGAGAGVAGLNYQAVN